MSNLTGERARAKEGFVDASSSALIIWLHWTETGHLLFWCCTAHQPSVWFLDAPCCTKHYEFNRVGYFRCAGLNTAHSPLRHMLYIPFHNWKESSHTYQNYCNPNSRTKHHLTQYLDLNYPGSSWGWSPSVTLCAVLWSHCQHLLFTEKDFSIFYMGDPSSKLNRPIFSSLLLNCLYHG